MNWNIFPIGAIGRSVSSLKRDPFNSGYPELDIYLKQYAKKNDEAGIAKTYVAIASEGSIEIAGYYCCNASQIERRQLPVEIQDRLPGYPLPTILIGKLAVDFSMQGRGLGKQLLLHAIENAIDVSQIVGVYAVKVDAINEQAKEFYTRFGFRQLPETPLSLLLPLARLKQANNLGRSQQSETSE